MFQKKIASTKLSTTFQNRLKNWVSTGENGFHIIFLHEVNLRYWKKRLGCAGPTGQRHGSPSALPRIFHALAKRGAQTTINGHLAPVKTSPTLVETFIMTEGHLEEKHKGV